MARPLFLLLLLMGSCNLPKDPEGSLGRAHSGQLMVGFVHHPPYSYHKEGKAGGSEVAIIDAFCRQNGLKVRYVYGSESDLVKQLEAFRLDIVIGGFTKKTPWKDKAGLTVPYNETNCLLVAPGENALLYRLEEHLLKLEEHGS